MLTLYDHPLSGNCHKVRLFLSILGMGFESVFIDVPKHVNREAAFTAINPLQQIPVLKDDGYTVQDSQAILLYLALRYRPSWAGKDPQEAGSIMQWLSFAANEIGNSLQPARVFYLLGEHVDIDLVRKRSLRVLGLLDAHLAKHEWLSCGRPTIADLVCFPYVGLAREGRLPLDDFSRVLAWIKRVVALEGYVSMPGLPEPRRA
jgi:glutathione S-transferase